MKKLIAVIALTISAVSAAQNYQQPVRGYVRRDGTYVAPHYRTKSNDSASDNWSSQGNTNPYNGRQGTEVAPPRNDNFNYAPPHDSTWDTKDSF